MSVSRARALRRSDFDAIDRYCPDQTPVPIDLSDNTNRWGMCPDAVRAIQTLAGAASSRYPEPYGETLKGAIAAYLGVPAECVVTGCGSDDVLDSAIRAFAEPGATLALSDPSFAMVPALSRMNGLVTELVPLTSSYDVDAAALLSCDPSVVYVCSPNNPTGTLASRAAIEWIADCVNGVLIVDEAYAEFSGVTAVDLAMRRPNVLVVRTMSKAFGLAALRVGYAVGAPGLVSDVEKSRGPYKVSALGAAAATAALERGLEWMRAHVGAAIAHRHRLIAELRVRSIVVLPTAANFVLAPVDDARGVATRMREQGGVAVRAFPALRPVSDALRRTNGGALRITAGPWAELACALDAFDEAVRP